MIRLFLSTFMLASAITAAAIGHPQDEVPPASSAAAAATPTAAEVADEKFHRNVIKAAQKLAAEKKITRLQMVRLRMAMLSPGFRERAQDLAVIQMTTSMSDKVPYTESGAVDRASIDWDALLAFIERLIPLILQLIEIFSGAGSTSGQAPAYAVVVSPSFALAA